MLLTGVNALAVSVAFGVLYFVTTDLNLMFDPFSAVLCHLSLYRFTVSHIYIFSIADMPYCYVHIETRPFEWFNVSFYSRPLPTKYLQSTGRDYSLCSYCCFLFFSS